MGFVHKFIRYMYEYVHNLHRMSTSSILRNVINQELLKPGIVIKSDFQIQWRSYNASSKVRREGKIWREKHKLPAHINQTNALMNGADYRFLDGRPTPYGVKQYSRIEKQKALAEQIVNAVGEMNFAVDRWKRLEKEKSDNIKSILDKKLKPKGGFIK